MSTKSYADIEPALNSDFKKKIFKISKPINDSYKNNHNYNKYEVDNFKIEKMFEKILMITNNMSEKIDCIDKKFDEKLSNLEYKIACLENKFDLSKNTKNNDNMENIDGLKELIPESLNIEKEHVLKALSYRDYRSLTYILKLYYKNENNKFSFRQISTKKYEYYFNKSWVPDLYGDYCRKIFCKNIQNLFIKYNDIDDEEINSNDFMLNQEFICQLMDEKKMKELFKSVSEEIKINQ